jgi:hypothetical protein
MLGVNVKQFLIIDECSAINMICSQSGTFCFSIGGLGIYTSLLVMFTSIKTVEKVKLI